MTTQEAIEQLKLTRAANKCNYADKYIIDAFDMAIRSLEAWEKVKEEIEEWHNIRCTSLTWNNYKGITEIIDKHLQEVDNG